MTHVPANDSRRMRLLRAAGHHWLHTSLVLLCLFGAVSAITGFLTGGISLIRMLLRVLFMATLSFTSAATILDAYNPNVGSFIVRPFGLGLLAFFGVYFFAVLAFSFYETHALLSGFLGILALVFPYLIWHGWKQMKRMKEAAEPDREPST